MLLLPNTYRIPQNRKGRIWDMIIIRIASMAFGWSRFLPFGYMDQIYYDTTFINIYPTHLLPRPQWRVCGVSIVMSYKAKIWDCTYAYIRLDHITSMYFGSGCACKHLSKMSMKSPQVKANIYDFDESFKPLKPGNLWIKPFWNKEH